MDSPSILDAAIGAGVLAFALWGLKEGFIQGSFKYLAVAVGIYSALAGTSLILSSVPNAWFPSNAIWLRPAAGAMAFVAGMGLTLILGKLLSRLIGLTPLGWIDRLLGALLGIAKIGLLLVVLAIPMVAWKQWGDSPSWVRSSQLLILAETHLSGIWPAVRKKATKHWLQPGTEAESVKEPQPPSGIVPR